MARILGTRPIAVSAQVLLLLLLISIHYQWHISPNMISLIELFVAAEGNQRVTAVSVLPLIFWVAIFAFCTAFVLASLWDWARNASKRKEKEGKEKEKGNTHNRR